MFWASDLPMGVTIEAHGLWENAHSRACVGSGDDSAAPPRLQARELRLASSGIFGIFKKCKSVGNQKVCRNVSYMVLEVSDSPVGPARTLDARPGNGKYLAPIQPGHYYVFGQRVDVKPSQWTRLDIRLPE